MNRLVRIVSLVLVFSLCAALPVAAEEISPYASSYFGSHNAYLWGTSSTSFQVWFSVSAVAGMTELGADYIEVERSSDGVNWSVVATYTKEAYPNLIAKNTGTHSTYVTYSNKQSGYQYRAYIELYAKNSAGGRGYNGVYAYF